jgi:hypothetical protein
MPVHCTGPRQSGNIRFVAYKLALFHERTMNKTARTIMG